MLIYSVYLPHIINWNYVFFFLARDLSISLDSDLTSENEENFVTLKKAYYY